MHRGTWHRSWAPAKVRIKQNISEISLSYFKLIVYIFPRSNKVSSQQWSWWCSLLDHQPPTLSQVGPRYFSLKKIISEHQAKLHSDANVKPIPDVILKRLTSFQGVLFSNTGSGVGLPACQSQLGPCCPFVTAPEPLWVCFLICRMWRTRESLDRMIAESNWSVARLQKWMAYV